LQAEERVPKRSAAELNLSARHLYNFITSDFESAWAALSLQKAEGPFKGRGNFMFARQAMALLEFACRLIGRSDEAREAFSRALFDIEPRYFTLMPGQCRGPESDPLLPFSPQHGRDSANRTLLAALFDMVRHGLAHQYQGITVELSDGRVLAASLSGVVYREELGTNLRRELYLGYLLATSDDMLIRLYPDVLYLDVKEAIRKSNLLDRGLALDYFVRGGGGDNYGFDAAAVRNALADAGHAEVKGRPGIPDA
jgi:hypothetical protein